MNLKDKVAIVTGSTRGIGKAIALKFAQEGANVVVCGTTEAAAQAVAKEAEAHGVKSLGVGLNVSSASEVERLVKRTVDTFGAIHILVNNAGVTRDGLILRMKEEDWDLVQSVNLKSAFLCTKYAVKYIMKGYGRIINVSSVAGITGNAGQANYAASKAGLIGFTKSVAKEFGRRGITANVIAPGYIDTDMTAGLDPALKAKILEQIPLQSFGAAVQVAHVAAFLAGPGASYVTGQVLCVDGGLAM